MERIAQDQETLSVLRQAGALNEHQELGLQDVVFLIIGNSEQGGAAKVQWKLDIWGSQVEYGSRLAIFFSP